MPDELLCLIIQPVTGQPPRVDSITVTSRQMEIVRLVSEGLTDRAVGEALSISARTVSNHLSELYAVTGVSSRAHLVSLLLKGQLRVVPQHTNGTKIRR